MILLETTTRVIPLRDGMSFFESLCNFFVMPVASERLFDVVEKEIHKELPVLGVVDRVSNGNDLIAVHVAGYDRPAKALLLNSD